MRQRATIESIPEAFSMLKQMRGQEVEWGEDYREAGALALKAVLEQGMAARIDRHLEEMAGRGETCRTGKALPHSTAAAASLASASRALRSW